MHPKPTRKINRRTFLKISGAVAGVGLIGGIATQLGWEDSILLGMSRCMLPLPRAIWKSQLKGGPTKLDFMTEEHHRIRDFVVMELPRCGEPLSPESIAETLHIPTARVADILVDLERHMTFLFRDETGAVTWAYPVTTDKTPHHVTFSTGEQIYAA